MGTQTQVAYQALSEHMRRYPGDLLKAGTFAGEEFDRLYLEWTRSRWDDGHPWTREVWAERP
jgi:hypothetical protein